MGVAHPNTDPASCTWARRSRAQPVWPTYLINWRGVAQFIILINLGRRGANMVNSIIGVVRRGVARNIPGNGTQKKNVPLKNQKRKRGKSLT